MNSRNNQNKLIRRLLQIGKKHKVLVYPMLALVALVSAFSYMYRWASGSGKRIVAAVLVGVMVISQSYFMTSSANENALIYEEEEESLIDTSAVDEEEEEAQSSLVDSQEADASDDAEEETSALVDSSDVDEEEDDVEISLYNYSDDTTEGSSTEESSTEESSTGGKITQIQALETNSINLPAGTTEAKIENTDYGVLPDSLFCCVVDANNSPNWKSMEVTWAVKDTFISTDSQSSTFRPTLVDADQYTVNYSSDENATNDYNGIEFTVNFYTSYLVELAGVGDDGSLSLSNSSFLVDDTGIFYSKGTYYGFIGSSFSYDLPTVTRYHKEDGTKEFEYTWTSNSTSGNISGNKYYQTNNDVTEVTLTLEYTEAEITYVDYLSDGSGYDYPAEGRNYMIKNSPSEVYGYTFAGWSESYDETSSNSSNANNTIKSIDKVDDVTLYAVWKPLDYTIEYNANYNADKGNGSMNGVKYTYDETAYFADCGYTRYGYRFVGWSTSDGDSNTVEYEAGEEITSDIIKTLFGGDNLETNGNSSTTLYAVWEKVNITYDDGEQEQSIAATYGTESKEEYTFVNTAGTQSSYFNVGISKIEVDNETFKNDSDLSSYFEEGSGIISTSGATMTVKATPIQTWDSMVLKLKVTDVTAGTSSDLTLTIGAAKKELTIASVSGVSKVYDGTTNVETANITAMEIKLSEIYGNDDISVNKTADGFGVVYADANAGESKTLKFSGLSLTGDKADYYTIENELEVSNAAVITQRALYVTVTGSVYKYSGESVPDQSSWNISIEYMDADKWKGCGLDYIEATKELIKNEGGLSLSNTKVMEISYVEPTDNSEGKYDITVTIQSTNYVVTSDASCILVVTQDAAVLQTEDTEEGTYNYSISGTYNEATGWYTDMVTIQPKLQHGEGYYDKIMVYGTSVWVASVTIDDDSDYNAQELRIQLLNDRTGAYTALSDFMTIKVDTKAPVYEGAEFSDVYNTGLLENLGNFFTYGNFFKESVNATLTFSDNKSGCDYIYYDLDGSGEYVRKSISNGSITLTIPLSTNNEISFYTVDVAGNQSKVTYLLGSEDGSEWVIENVKPQIVGYYIANMDGDIISNLSSGGWYNQEVQIVATVSESMSGIHYADWYINGELDEVEITELYRSDSNSSTVTLSYPFTESGIYEVALAVTDNATNATDKTDLTTIQIDTEAPVISVDEDSITDDWTQSVDVPFTVTDDVSGVYKVSVVTPTGSSYQLTAGTDGVYTLTADVEGEYTIYARDEAYNESSVTITLGNISTEVPDNATVTWSPENPDGSNSWYTSQPTATITPAESDLAVPVTTYYKFWNGSTEPSTATAITDTAAVTASADGEWTLKVWSETAAGVSSVGVYEQTVYVDTTAPEAMVTKVVAETSYQTVTFTVTDATSGISSDQIKVVNGSTTVSSTLTALSDGSGYQGTFTVSSAGDYVVQVYDNAGNLSTSATYTPMTLKVNAVKNITKSTATISSISYRGTNAISSVKYEYKKASASSYKEITPYTVKDDDGNVTASYSFKNLKANTKYNYRITAVSAIGEALTYTGSFKTTGTSGIGITGRVVDANDSTAAITVSLLEGNTTLQTTEITSGEYFVFTKVADGNYNITATNGTTTKTISVNVSNGVVVDPSGDILITLRAGMSTTVVVTDANTPDISVSGLDDIFTYDTVNFTEDDKEFIAAGGIVEFGLTATSKSASSISSSALSSIYSLMTKKEKVSMFLDLTLTKIRTYASGAVESTKKVTELAGGVNLKIVIPLPTKVVNASEKSVIRYHGSSAKRLSDVDSSETTYTISSSKFSIYALTYKKTSESESTTEDVTTTEEDEGTKSIKSYDSSPKTGDEAPLAVLGGFMMISLAGLIVLKKKSANRF